MHPGEVLCPSVRTSQGVIIAPDDRDRPGLRVRLLGDPACKALRLLGYEIVLVNSNPATIMTDPGMADATYIEPLNLQY